MRRSNAGASRIIMYHRINADSSVSSIDPQLFYQQIQHLKKYYRVVPIEQLIEQSKTDRLAPNTVAITFDDGYQDFYHVIWPILRELQVPASLYVTTAFIDDEQWLWPDLLKYIFIHAKTKTIVFDSLGSLSIDPTNFMDVWNRVADFLLPMSAEHRQQLLDDLARQCHVELPKQPIHPYTSLSWTQLNEMYRQGLDVGSHTVSHPLLSRLTKEQIHDELESSALKIKQRMGFMPKGLCYPNGRLEDVNSAVINTAMDVGYDYGLLAVNDVQQDDESMAHFRIGRIAAAHDLIDFKWRLLRRRS